MRNRRMLMPFLALAALLCPLNARGQEGVARGMRMEAVRVTGPRPLAVIGEQKTVLDSAMLREGVVLSIADLLSQNTALFIKSHGRATLSTASFRGTAASHTQVTWNGMRINSPMLGMVDFSYIPAYFVDGATLYHGASSTGVSSGGLGGAVSLSTKAGPEEGLEVNYVQGVGSYDTWDEFLRVDYGRRRLQSTTRLLLSTSDNDFSYTNYYKKKFVTDENGRVTGWSYPVERNRNAGWRDLHIMQELAWDGGRAGRFSLAAWFMDSERGIAMLNTDYRDEGLARARQDEATFRAVASWEWLTAISRLAAKAGYLYTDLLYVNELGLGNGLRTESVHAQSYVNTAFGELTGEYCIGRSWYFTARLTAHQHFVRSRDDAYVPASSSDPLGYDKARVELSAFASARYKPAERVGLGVNLRVDMFGDVFSDPVPAFFFDWLLAERGNVVLKASAARNHRFPTLNDMYFRPGGNPNLKPETGFTYDAGAEFSVRRGGWELKGNAAWFDSYISDWILWRYTGGGYSTPINVRRVHSYGVEASAKVGWAGDDWHIGASGTAAWTRSVNRGDKATVADESIGKQLPYVPVWSSSLTLRTAWRQWSAVWKWNYFSERFTATDNSLTPGNRLAPYFMNDVSVGRSFAFRAADVALRLNVNNIFGEQYESELSRPMAGRNWGFTISIKPKFRR